MGVGAGQRTISTFASANAPDAPYAAEGGGGEEGGYKRSFEEMGESEPNPSGYRKVRARRTEESTPHVGRRVTEFHKMRVKGYGLGEDLTARMQNPTLAPLYDDVIKALHMGTGVVLTAAGGEFAGTIPSSSRLLRDVRFDAPEFRGGQ